MQKLTICLAIAAGLAFTLPASAEDSAAGMKDQKATTMQKDKTTKPTTSGAAQDSKDATKKSKDDPNVYGKPDKH